MTMSKLTDEHLKQRAFVYVRQSTLTQLAENHESRRRQYALEDYARELGFADVEVIDQDLGVTSSGMKERPGFERLVAAVCTGDVGAVLCAEASRLARNGRDWHHLLELCALTKTLLIDPRDAYDPRDGNDRLLLGLQGAMSEYELTLLRERSAAAIASKAARGELQFNLPVGLCWTHDGRIELDPDERVRETLGMVFEKFQELGSARQTFLWLRDESVRLPCTEYEEFGREIAWKPAKYGAVLKLLNNPLYAGAYAWGKTNNRTELVNGRARKTRGHRKPRDQWRVLIREHHPGYIDWPQYLRNQKILAENTFMKSGGRKSGRGGRALLGGLLRCRRCGRRLNVAYPKNAIRYTCPGGYPNTAQRQCMAFGGVRVDQTISRAVLRAVERPALEAAVAAHEHLEQRDCARLQALALELEEADYQVRIAHRRYESVDPDNRLVARELEKRWEAALRRSAEARRELEAAEAEAADRDTPSIELLESLAVNLPIVWDDERTDPKLKQRIVRILIDEVVADVDDEAREIVLLIHWTGGRHSEHRVRKNKAGRNSNATGHDASAVIDAMIGRFTDLQIARTLNGLGLRTGKGNTWTKLRVCSYRSHRSLPRFDPDSADPNIVTLAQAAEILGVSSPSVRKLIDAGVVPGTQVIDRAPWEIPADSLDSDEVRDAVESIRSRDPRSQSSNTENETVTIPGL